MPSVCKTGGIILSAMLKIQNIEEKAIVTTTVPTIKTAVYKNVSFLGGCGVGVCNSSNLEGKRQKKVALN